MQFCPKCESLMTPVQNESQLWECDQCDFAVKVRGKSEEALVSTKIQEQDSKKSVKHNKWTVIKKHPEAPNSCQQCGYRGLALRAEEYTGGYSATVRRRYLAQCKKCNHEEKFYEEREPILGAPDSCPSCGNERLYIELDTDTDQDSMEYSGKAECQECGSVCYFQTVKE